MEHEYRRRRKRPSRKKKKIGAMDVILVIVGIPFWRSRLP